MIVSVVAAIVERNEQVLVTRRPPGSHLAGMWEFPGGKIGDGESHPAEWHTARLVEAGFREAGLAWRSVSDALIAAVR